MPLSATQFGWHVDQDCKKKKKKKKIDNDAQYLISEG